MIDKDIAIERLYREAFNDTDDFVKMYFERIYRDDEAMVVESGDRIVGSLLLQHYRMNLYGDDSQVSYIAAATTDRRFRGKGFMKQLMKQALIESRRRGDILSTLIPAEEWLYDYYSQFGFSTVFYCNEERFTAGHCFTFSGDYEIVENIFSTEAYGAFNRMMHSRINCVQHSFNDYLDILKENEIDGGCSVAISERTSGEIAAFAVAVVNDETLVVKELLSIDKDAANAILSILTSKYPHKSLTVITMPHKNSQLPLVPKGMARIVNVGQMLKNFALAYPLLKLNLRVSDSVISENSHIYFVDNGCCTMNDGYLGQLDLDVTVDVLTSIIFSDEKIGDILGFTPHRPYISLMHD